MVNSILVKNNKILVYKILVYKIIKFYVNHLCIFKNNTVKI
jgi:hypothetical protein